MNQKYEVFDVNNKELVNYKTNYIIVFDNKPFQLNNYSGNLEELLTLNYIMKEEYPEFSFVNIFMQTGKTYYNVSLSNYNKLLNLKDVKGIYMYTSKEADVQRYYNISNYFLSIDDNKEYESDTVESHLKDVMKDNNVPRRDFLLNDNYVYKDDGINNTKNNKNIKLTIDGNVEESIKDTLKDEKFSDIKNASVLLMESKSGKIKAMVQKDDDEANINLCVNALGYEPGSIYKLITLGAALDKGLVSMNSNFSCNGEICSESHIHGLLNVNKALVLSCNDVFGKIGSMVGYNDLTSYSKKLGLYDRVLNLSEETKGTKPRVEAGMNNVSIGQCFTVSPLQMLGACNTIVNNGVYVKPNIIENIFINNTIIEPYIKEEEKVFDETSAMLIKNSMKEVVSNGTGVKAQVNGVTVGGKTGTANSSIKDTVHGWFFGYFTINGTEYSMIVFVPNMPSKDAEGVECGGGNTAAPIFSSIVEKLTKML